MLEVHNIVGIHTRDPQLPGSLYLTEEGDLTKDPRKARRVEDAKLHKALREIRSFGSNFFVQPIAD